MKTTYQVQVLCKYVANTVSYTVDSFDNQDEAIHFFKKYTKRVVGKRFPGTQSKIAKSHLRLVAVTPIFDKWDCRLRASPIKVAI